MIYHSLLHEVAICATVIYHSLLHEVAICATVIYHSLLHEVAICATVLQCYSSKLGITKSKKNSISIYIYIDIYI